VRRVLVGLAVVVLAAVVVGAGILALQARDDAEIGGPAAGPGERVTDRCPARRSAITRDRRRLSRAQIQTALARGNVVILYGARPSGELLRLQRDVAGPFDAELAAAGQAVVLAEDGVPAGYEARAWGRRMSVGANDAPQLRDFAEAWLGKGAPEPCPS
jgi:hypothetical protein